MRSPTKSNQKEGRIDWVPCSVRHSRGVRARLVTLLGSISAGREEESDCNCSQGPATHGFAGKPIDCNPRHRSKVLWSDDGGEALIEHKTPRMPDRHWRSS